MTTTNHSNLLHARGLRVEAPGGRPLFAELSLSIDTHDKVALVGRNGVGKSALLQVLAGEAVPARGQLHCIGRRVVVPQLLSGGVTSESPGELRRARLCAALDAEPELLLLDEPTLDLDERSHDWLLQRLARFSGALIVVSHDLRLLRTFNEFFVAAESGCRHVRGPLQQLLANLEYERSEQEQRYARELQRLLDDEQHNAIVRRRRQRKKNLGRLHELKRCPSRAKLNAKRSYKQVSQGKRAVLQAARIGAARTFTKAARRALAVQLPLELVLPELPVRAEGPIATLDDVGYRIGPRTLFTGLSLQLARQRIAISGPNGAGKTTLLQLLLRETPPTEGSAACDLLRIGYVAQHASNFLREESLLQALSVGSDPVTIEAAVASLRAHRFPLALAERPLRSLSPGERVRAALIELFQRRPAPELLILDEPSEHLDLLGAAALHAVLGAWRGGLVLVSHDRGLLDAAAIEHRLELGREQSPRLAPWLTAGSGGWTNI